MARSHARTASTWSSASSRATAARYGFWGHLTEALRTGRQQNESKTDPSASPSGANFDLPVVGPIFDEYAASFGLSQRLRFLPGDFFNDPLPQADVLVMGHILHDWNLEQKKAIIAKAYAALPPGGALLIYEALIDDDRRQNAFGLLMSLNMLIETPGGFDYTGADCCTWLKQAGFRQTRVEHLVGPDSMVVGVK